MSQTIEGTSLMVITPKAAATSLAVVEPPKKPFWERAWLIGGAVQGLNRKTFEGRVGKLIGSALAHEQEGLPAGSQEYTRLSRMADESIKSYCDAHLVDRGDLEAMIPAINKLRNLAVPKPPQAPAWMRPGTIFAGFIGTAAVAAFLGLDCGLFHAAREFVIFHFSH